MWEFSQAVFLGPCSSCCTLPTYGNWVSQTSRPFMCRRHATLHSYASEPDCRAVGQVNSLHYWHRGLDVIELSETQCRKATVHCPGHTTEACEDDSRLSHTEEDRIAKSENITSLNNNWTHLCYSSPDTVIALFLSTVTALFTIRHSLNEAAKTSAFVITQLDYCNSVLSGITKILLDKPQSVLNAAACLISKLRKFDYITSTFRLDLYWLPIEQRVDLEVSVIIYQCVHGTALEYLTEMLTLVTIDQAIVISIPQLMATLWYYEHQYFRSMKLCCQGTSHLEWAFILYVQQWLVMELLPPRTEEILL